MYSISMTVCGHCDTGLFLRCAGDMQTCDCGYVSISDSGAVCQDDQDFYKTYPAVTIKHSAEKLQRDFDDLEDRYGRLPNGTAMAKRLSDDSRSFTISKRRHFEDDLAQLAALTVED